MTALESIISLLRQHYGPTAPRLPSDPFELILWENVAYLADDARRRRAFALLRKSVGTRPEEILAAKPAALRAVTRHGILPDEFAAKLRDAARIAREEFHSDLDEVVRRPLIDAKRALRKFPGIGEPGAEKILLFSRRHVLLAPDSNALRVLTRLGICPEASSYAQTYAAARKLADEQLEKVLPRVIEAHHVLRRHGQMQCRRTLPLCGECPVASLCPSATRFIGPPSQAVKRRAK
jgi:endonuclease III